MLKAIEEMKDRADLARSLYRGGQISRIEAEEEIRPYAEAFNAKSRELAKKYGQRPRPVSYTHLDVYKRQAPLSTSWPRGRSSGAGPRFVSC